MRESKQLLFAGYTVCGVFFSSIISPIAIYRIRCAWSFNFDVV